MFWVKLLVATECVLPSAGLHWSYLATFNLEVTQTEVELAGLPPAFDGYRIVLISCLHTSGFGPRELLLRRELRYIDADVLIMAGDFHKYGSSVHRTLGATRRIFQGLEFPDGLVATKGNHDSWSMVRPLREMGFRVLFNDCYAVYRGGVGPDRGASGLTRSVEIAEGGRCRPATLSFVGVAAARRRDPDWIAALRGAAPDSFKIGICHSPDGAVTAARHPISLLLCGHTHGGQIRLPGVGPLITETRLVGPRFAAGLCRYRDMPVYVNRGIGWTRMPIRFRCRPEISVLTLRSPR
ncbi:MAG: metallophosphoesterase [Phycisphaerales bacterium]|nr:MAG: metallophosphoesterase [Phycisphaerales bacterium]